MMKRLIVFLWLSGALLISCDRSANNNETRDTPDTVSERSETLSQGALFNEKDLTGWRFFKNKTNDSWEVVDGTLHSKPFDVAEKRADLITESQYENFELSFEWKIASQSNTGVMFRVTEAFDEPYLSGPEYQIIDDHGPGERKKEQLTGANYDMHAAPDNKVLNPTGDWNSSRLVVFGNHVEHWLNGKQLFAYEIGSDDWQKRKAASKWNDVKGYAASTKGHVVLQDHGSEAWFRNITIKPLQ